VFQVDDAVESWNASLRSDLDDEAAPELAAAD